MHAEHAIDHDKLLKALTAYQHLIGVTSPRKLVLDPIDKELWDCMFNEAHSHATIIYLLKKKPEKYPALQYLITLTPEQFEAGVEYLKDQNKLQALNNFFVDDLLTKYREHYDTYQNRLDKLESGLKALAQPENITAINNAKTANPTKSLRDILDKLRSLTFSWIAHIAPEQLNDDLKLLAKKENGIPQNIIPAVWLIELALSEEAAKLFAALKALASNQRETSPAAKTNNVIAFLRQKEVIYQTAREEEQGVFHFEAEAAEEEAELEPETESDDARRFKDAFYLLNLSTEEIKTGIDELEFKVGYLFKTQHVLWVYWKKYFERQFQALKLGSFLQILASHRDELWKSPEKLARYFLATAQYSHFGNSEFLTLDANIIRELMQAYASSPEGMTKPHRITPEIFLAAVKIYRETFEKPTSPSGPTVAPPPTASVDERTQAQREKTQQREARDAQQTEQARRERHAEKFASAVQKLSKIRTQHPAFLPLSFHVQAESQNSKKVKFLTKLNAEQIEEFWRKIPEQDRPKNISLTDLQNAVQNANGNRSLVDNIYSADTSAPSIAAPSSSVKKSSCGFWRKANHGQRSAFAIEITGAAMLSSGAVLALTSFKTVTLQQVFNAMGFKFLLGASLASTPLFAALCLAGTALALMGLFVYLASSITCRKKPPQAIELQDRREYSSVNGTPDYGF